jgi:adenylate cyclase
LGREKAYLVVLGGERTQELHLDDRSSWTVGRDAENTFTFEDNAMSRRHAVIQQMEAGRFYFTDLGSRNGSFVNGRRVTGSVELHNGDSLVCGGTQLIFRGPLSAPAVARPEAGVSAATLRLYARCFLTTLVVDIRDFTPLTRRLKEEILAQVMGTWFREVDAIVKHRGSSGDKFIGDAVMAVWTHRTESPTPDEVWPVLEAVHEIQSFTTGLQEQFHLSTPVRIGAGINTGVSIVGNVGADDNPEFSPLGDNVNAAFRLESATKEHGYDIALGRATFECLGTLDVRQFFENRPIELKGYENVVDSWLTSFANLELILNRRKPSAPPQLSGA